MAYQLSLGPLDCEVTAHAPVRQVIKLLPWNAKELSIHELI